ncbi:MAG: LPS export ABC transporter permease LptG [Janthinobacterium lividum]
MKVLQRYLAAENVRAVGYVLVAFLALFAFFDLIGELKSVGKGGYGLGLAFLYVAMGLPGYAYDLMPIAALIGTIYVLAQMASTSEFTIMRVSSMSTGMAASMLFRIGILFALLTFVFGEFVAPRASEYAEKLKLGLQGTSVSQQFRSGLWAKDVIKEDGANGAPIGTRFLNVREMKLTGELLGLKIYEFDGDFRMSAVISAASATYSGRNTWSLKGVSVTTLPKPGKTQGGAGFDLSAPIAIKTFEQRDLVSEITPDILAVLFADPDRMSATDLSAYTKHLTENKQQSERYEIAYWKKLIYPFAVFVMMALALPFAYLHARAGGVSLKIFSGIMLGVSFQLINSLFSHIGLLNTWPPLITAALPSLLFLLIAIVALLWVERH